MKRFPKTLSTILLSLLLAISLVGCQSAQPVESVPEIVVPEAAPVVDQPSAAQESVAAEEVAVVEEAPSTGESAPVAQPITGTLSAYGYTVGYSATVGRAVVTYPANVIYEEDIAAFAQYINERHGDLLDGVTFDVVTPGVLVLTYPEGVSVADGEAVINMLAPELDAFIASYLAAPSAQEAAAPAEEAPATVAEPITGRHALGLRLQRQLQRHCGHRHSHIPCRCHLRRGHRGLRPVHLRAPCRPARWRLLRGHRSRYPGHHLS